MGEEVIAEIRALAELLWGARVVHINATAYGGGVAEILQTLVPPMMKAIWQRYNEANARRLEGEYDFITVHDPQPAGLLHYHGRAGGKHWVWRCHIDTSQHNPAYWEFFVPYISSTTLPSSLCGSTWGRG